MPEPVGDQWSALSSNGSTQRINAAIDVPSRARNSEHRGGVDGVEARLQALHAGEKNLSVQRWEGVLDAAVVGLELRCDAGRIAQSDDNTDIDEFGRADVVHISEDSVGVRAFHPSIVDERQCVRSTNNVDKVRDQRLNQG
jgi:hypothetical protein